ncbi:MAG: uncharacterized protein QOG53_506 [Frankiales bacterium]|jgi:uncharacterized protein YqjF (DUF2071 family)|nr:uncharacterized protein [Frankiales bacterium]
MRMQWLTLTFMHWPYPADAVQRLLPPGLTVETYDGHAWVGLVPFTMTVAFPRAPAVPWLSRFPETNVRTYARGPRGETGVWFMSLDAARLPAVLAARGAWGLPYYWARMQVQRRGNTVDYTSVRHRPHAPAAHLSRVEIGSPIAASDVTTFEHYLTARFALWSHHLGRNWHARADHPPWPLHRARVAHLDDELVLATGLPAPCGDPIVHFSEGVDVRVGRPRLCG